MWNAITSFFRCLYARLAPPHGCHSEPIRFAQGELREESAVTPQKHAVSRELLRKLLLDALDDPAFAKLLARRLLLPTFPIQGSNPDNVTTAGGTAGYVPYFTSSLNIEESVVFQDTANGRVGIGTITPAKTLDVAGQIRIISAATELHFWETNQTLPQGRWRLTDGGSGTAGANMVLQENTAAAGDFSTVNSAIYFKSGGNVGIGTTSPSALLDVRKDQNATTELQLANENNTSAAAAKVDVRVGGASAADPFAAFDVTGVGGWSVGLDNSDGDKLKIDRGNPPSPGNDTKLTIDTSGNVGIGTTSPDNKLHVMDGHIAIEASSTSQVKLKFRQSGATRNEIFRDSADFTVIRNLNQVYTNLKLWAPQESTFPTTPREATLALVRALDDETKTEFLDLYNNYYSTEKQYGIRIAKSGSGTSFHDFVFDQYDGDLDQKTPLMILKVDGKVGIGESSPDYKLDVNGAIGFTPGSSVTPVDIGDVVFELTSDTTLKIKAKGSDGTVRSGTITLA